MKALKSILSVGALLVAGYGALFAAKNADKIADKVEDFLGLNDDDHIHLSAADTKHATSYAMNTIERHFPDLERRMNAEQFIKDIDTKVRNNVDRMKFDSRFLAMEYARRKILDALRVTLALEYTHRLSSDTTNMWCSWTDPDLLNKDNVIILENGDPQVIEGDFTEKPLTIINSRDVLIAVVV
jgi:hypothetical protein